jgi:hypothetical protein
LQTGTPSRSAPIVSYQPTLPDASPFTVEKPVTAREAAEVQLHGQTSQETPITMDVTTAAMATKKKTQPMGTGLTECTAYRNG